MTTAIIGGIAAFVFLGVLTAAMFVIRKDAADKQRAKDEAEAEKNARETERETDAIIDQPRDPERTKGKLNDGTA